LRSSFAALLAAEQKLGGSLAPPTPADITDEFVAQVTERVLVRLGESTVRESVTSVVLDVAEHLVCGGRVRLIALIEEAAVIGRILGHLGRPADLPGARPARAPPLFAAAGEVKGGSPGRRY
jgi:hypothetical protein